MSECIMKIYLLSGGVVCDIDSSLRVRGYICSDDLIVVVADGEVKMGIQIHTSTLDGFSK